MKWVKSRIPEIVNAYLAKKTYMDFEPIKEKRSKEEEIMIRLMHSVLTISEINDLDSVSYRGKKEQEEIKKLIAFESELKI